MLDVLDLKSAICDLQQHIVKYANGYKKVLLKLNHLQQSVDNLQGSRQLYDFDSDLFLADDRQSPIAEDTLIIDHAHLNSSEIKKSTPILSEDTEQAKPLIPANTGKMLVDFDSCVRGQLLAMCWFTMTVM